MTHRGRGRPPYPDVLTPAEWRVLEEVRTGATNAEIAVRLGVSPDTVKYHVSNILGKLELRNRREIAVWRPTRDRVRLGERVAARLSALAAPFALKPLLGFAVAAGVALIAIPAIVLAILLTRPAGDANLLLTPAPAEGGATFTPTPDATPAPTPDPTPDSIPNALGIREIALDDAFVRLEYASGELIDEDASVFFLDIEAGAVEGWRSVAGGDPLFSHGYRYAATDAALHDRETGRTFAWDPNVLQVAGFEQAPYWRGGSTGSYTTPAPDEGVAFRRIDLPADAAVQRYVIVDPSMDEVGTFEIPADWNVLHWNLDAGLALARDSDAMHIIDVFTGSSLPVDEQPYGSPLAVSGASFARVTFAGEFARSASGNPVAGAQGPCRAVRRDWASGEVLSDLAVDCFDGNSAGARLSPDGRLLAAVTRVLDCCDEWFGHAFYYALTTVSVFDATSGDELLRIAGATFPFRHGGGGDDSVWLADSSALVVKTVHGLQIVTVDGQWLPLPAYLSSGHLRPSPGIPDRFIHDLTTIVDLDGQVLASPTFHQSVSLSHSAWNPSGEEVRLLPRIDGKGASPVASALLPALQIPPFDDALTAEVVVDTCLNVREQPTTNSEIVVCLPPERVVELIAHPDDGYIVEGPCFEEDVDGRCVWVHVRTGDGEEGWAYTDFLGWPGTPLPSPEPADPEAVGEG